MNTYNRALNTHQDDINSILRDLGEQLTNFTILNRQGQNIASICNVVGDDNYNLSLVVVPIGNNDINQLRIIDSALIQALDTNKKELYTNLNISDLEHLPLYSQSRKSENLIASPQTVDITPVDITPVETLPATKSEQKLTTFQTEVTIPLLEERLLVKRQKRKLGEIVVKKEIQTHLIEVPIRREVIIIEQVGSENIQLAEIDLANLESDDNPLLTAASTNSSISEYKIHGKFTSANIAAEILQQIAAQNHNQPLQVSIEIDTANPQQQSQFQQIIDRVAASNKHI